MESFRTDLVPHQEPLVWGQFDDDGILGEGFFLLDQSRLNIVDSGLELL